MSGEECRVATQVEYDVIQGQMEKPGETMKDELHIWQSSLLRDRALPETPMVHSTQDMVRPVLVIGTIFLCTLVFTWRTLFLEITMLPLSFDNASPA